MGSGCGRSGGVIWSGGLGSGVPFYMARSDNLINGVGVKGLVLVLGALAGSAAQAQVTDPFSAGTRWSRDAVSGTDWMAEQVSFAGRDQFVWSQAGGAGAHSSLLRTAGGVAIVDREETLLTGASTVRRSASGERVDRVFSLLQVDTGSGALRSTEVHAYAPFDTTRDVDMPPIWSHDMGALTLGEPYLETDRAGSIAVAAIWLSGQDAVQVDVLDGTAGSLLASGVLPGLALNSVCVSADGSRIAIAAGLDLYVLNAQAQVLHHEVLTATYSDLALSADGAVLATAGMAGTRMLDGDSQGYTQHQWIPAHPQNSTAQQTISVEVDLSDDGATLAVAQWSFVGMKETAFELWDTVSGVRSFRSVQASGPGSLQNLPTEARVTPDGKRAAFAAWGNGIDPEVLLVDRDTATLVQGFDTPGSVFCLDLDSTGTRLAVGHKLSHAQTFHSQGAFALLDSGERNLQAVSATRPGHELRIAAGHPGASVVLLLLGQPTQGVQVAGVSGMLLFDRSRVVVTAALADANGAAQFPLQVPAGWTSSELPFAIQAAFRLPTGTALTDGIIEPISLP